MLKQGLQRKIDTTLKQRTAPQIEQTTPLNQIGGAKLGASKELPDNLGPHDDEPKSRRSVDTNPKMRANLG